MVVSHIVYYNFKHISLLDASALDGNKEISSIQETWEKCIRYIFLSPLVISLGVRRHCYLPKCLGI